MYATICARNSQSVFPTAVLLNVRPRFDCTLCYSFKSVNWVNYEDIPIIDSTPLKSCHIKRSHSHKTMSGRVAKGRITMGWFYGFKLHIVINDRAEIMQWTLTPGNVDDREPLKDREFTKKFFGKIFADRGYISQELFENLFVDDIHLDTKIKKNMKNSLMNLYNKILLRKMSLI